MEIFFLSIHQNYAEMILSGTKSWEFRRNPNFGAGLKVGDWLFIVSMASQHSTVIAGCKICRILRGEEIDGWFGDSSSGHWLEAGCAEGTDRDWAFFTANILEQFSVAIRLHAYPVNPPQTLAAIRHCRSGKPWRGIGLTHLSELKQYRVNGIASDQFFLEMASSQAAQ